MTVLTRKDHRHRADGHKFAIRRNYCGASGFIPIIGTPGADFRRSARHLIQKVDAMQKLQQMIDAAFPGKEAERTPQTPSEGFVERERQFAETAARVEALRQTRANGSADAPSLLFEIVRHRGHWRILHKSRHSPPFADQTAAVAAAIKKAKAKRDAGFAVRVQLNRTDGDVVPQPLDEETPSADATTADA